MKLKETLFKECVTFVNKRLQTVEEIIKSNQKALQSQTKSSAGDKHETGRAMLQLEIEKASQQFLSIEVMKSVLTKIDFSKTSNRAHLGSIIETNTINYFLSISAGKIIVNNKNYFAISVSSPIGRQLMGKKTQEEFFFNGKKFQIEKIS